MSADLALPADKAGVTGRTRVLAILADPVVHVKAPPAINRIARERGKDAVMVPFEVAPEDLAGAFDALRRLKNFDGGIVTVPHKTAAVRLCDDISPAARAVGAVNVIRRTPEGLIVGDALDGIGFVAGLLAADIDVGGRSAYLVGAGGAANAIAFALVDAGVARLTLANRTRDKAAALRGRILAGHPGADVRIGGADPSGHDLVINGTSLGMRPGDPLPLDGAGLAPDMTVAEVVMEPEITPLLDIARDKGCRIHPGRPMLDRQLSLMADFFGL
ncbi:shikimate dehydrogenase family protein [Pseudochelatococcus sp. B33]